MSNSEIRSRAWGIYKANIIMLIAITSASTVLSLIKDSINNSVMDILLSIASTVFSIGYVYFIYRLWSDGTGKFSHFKTPFAQTEYSEKIIPIILTEAGLALVCVIPVIMVIRISMTRATVTSTTWLWIIISFIPLIITAYGISLVWNIFALNPEIKTWDIFKLSFSYMKRHWVGRMFFYLSLAIIPGIIFYFLKSGLNSIFIDTSGIQTGSRLGYINMIGNVNSGIQITNLIVSVLEIPVDAYISLAMSGYTYEVILNPAPQTEIQTPSLYESDMSLLPQYDETTESETERAEPHNENQQVEETTAE